MSRKKQQILITVHFKLLFIALATLLVIFTILVLTADWLRVDDSFYKQMAFIVGGWMGGLLTGIGVQVK